MLVLKLPFLALLATIVFMVSGVTASKYDLSKVLVEPLTVDYCTNFINEGQMFARSSEDKPAFIKIEGTARNYGPNIAQDTKTNITFVFLQNINSRLESKRLCYESGDNMGSVNLKALEGHVISTTSALVTGDNEITYMAMAPITTTGLSALMVCQCSFDSKTASTQVEYTGGTLEFHNSYGYLPGPLYGYLPFYAIMIILYVFLLLLYSGAMYRHREHMLGLQKLILVVVGMGLIENMSWWLNYNSMNSNGEPECCPIREGILLSIVVQNAKKVVSAVLVLSVCLGLGVVVPRLSKGQNFKIALLALFYFVSAVIHDFERIESIEHRYATGVGSTSIYGSFLVALSDVIFIFWINLALSNIMQELLEQRQIVKLGMYQSLARTLYTFVVLWVIYTITQMAIARQVVEVSWEHEYLLWGFWDILYFSILAVISYIWAPSETAAQYAYAMQLPTDDLDSDEFENQLEMNAPDTVEENFEIGDADFDEDDDDFEQEIEMVLNSPRKEGKGSENLVNT